MLSERGSRCWEFAIRAQVGQDIVQVMSTEELNKRQKSDGSTDKSWRQNYMHKASIQMPFVWLYKDVVSLHQLIY